jgi:K+-sensing histidine kinase KdpD
MFESSSKKKIMLAISSRSPQARALLDTAASLAEQLKADWYVVHVLQPAKPRKVGMEQSPLPLETLEYARSLGANVTFSEMRGDVAATLISVAIDLGIDYFITGRSCRSSLSLRWSLPLTERIQRQLPKTILLIV